MGKIALPFAIAAAVILATAQTIAAQSIRTFVSATGSNASALCTASAPCLTFAGALAKTAAGGEITVLDPGDYGPVEINKSVSIIAEGVEAGIHVASGDAVAVNAGANDIVILRGLILDDSGGDPLVGIRFLAGGALHIQKCVIRDFNSGIAQRTSANELYVSDTLLLRNSTGFSGQASETGTAVFDRVQIEGSVFSAIVVSSGNVTVRNSLVAGNNSTAFVANGFSVPSRLTIEGSAAVNNGTGISASGSAGTVTISDSTIAGNGIGLQSSSGGVIASFGNNRIAGNDTNGAPTTTIAPR